MRVQPRIALLDSLLLLGIAGQWWLVGRWIDRLRERSEHTKRWIISFATITICGIVVAAASFGNSSPWELVAIVLPSMALLAWMALLLMFVVTAGRWAIRFSRNTRATDRTSRA